MEKKVNVLSQSEHEIKVSLSYDEIKSDIEKAYIKEKAAITIPGFRKGKAPIQMIKKLYGETIEFRASEDIANKKFWEIVKEDNLKPLSGSLKLTELDYKGKDGLTFTVKYEVIPEPELKAYKNLKVKKPVFKIKKEEVEREFKRLILREAKLRETDIVEDKDTRLTLDLWLLDEEGNRPAKPSQKDVQVDLNDEETAPDIIEKSMNKKTGEEFQFTYVEKHKEGDEEHEHKYEYIAKITKIQKIILPELNEEICKKLSGNNAVNEKELREYVEKSLKEYYELKALKEYEKNLENEIIKQNDFTPPVTFVNEILNDMVEDELKKARQDGYSDLSKDLLSDYLRPEAERLSRLIILMETIGKKENITVQDEDLNALAEEESKKTGISKEKLLNYYKNSKYEERMLNDKIFKYLKEQNPPEEIDSEEYFKQIREEIKKAREKREEQSEQKEGK